MSGSVGRGPGVVAFKLEESKFRVDIWKKFLPISVLRPWNRLPREAVDVTPLSIQGHAGWGFEQIDLLGC